LTKKVGIILLFGIFLGGSVSADYYYNSGNQDNSDVNSFSIPEYDSQKEIATQLVAPFLLITVILQIGLRRALYFTLDTNSPLAGDSEKKKARKQATIIALIIAGMMIPTPLFQNLNRFVSWVFGSGIYILLGTAVIYFLYRLAVDIR